MIYKINFQIEHDLKGCRTMKRRERRAPERGFSPLPRRNRDRMMANGINL